jgi:hypothetical protein
MNSKTSNMILITTATVAALFLIRTCADGGAMGSAYRTCDCQGYEWQLYDRTPADGPRKTLCIGIVQSVTCLQTMGGPEIPCPE